jgi:hypothetical protein
MVAAFGWLAKSSPDKWSDLHREQSPLYRASSEIPGTRETRVNTVSSIIVRAGIDAATSCGLDAAALCEGLSFSPATVPTYGKRFSWDDFAEFNDRLYQALGPEGVQAFGKAVQVQVTTLKKLSGMIVSPRQFYHFAMGLSRWAYPHLRSEWSFTEDQMRLEVEVPFGYRDCAGFFHLSAGALRHLPLQLGLEPAEIRADIQPRRAIYLLRLPTSDSLQSRVNRARQTVQEFSDEFVVLMSTIQQELSDFFDWSQAEPDDSFEARMREAERLWKLDQRTTPMLELFVRGFTSEQAAQTLKVPEDEVKSVYSDLLERSGARDLGQLIEHFWVGLPAAR